MLSLLPGCEQDGGALRVAFTTTAGNADRAFVEPPDSLVMLLGHPPHGLAYPVTATVSDEGDIYVADFGHVVVRRFGPAGDFVRDYGAGQGEGPGEFQALVDVDVDEIGRVAGLDPLLSRVVVFDAMGGVVETITIPVPAYRFVRMANGDRVFVLAYADGSKVADVYEAATGDYRHSFHLPDREATGITVSGDRYVFMADTLVSVWEHRRSRE